MTTTTVHLDAAAIKRLRTNEPSVTLPQLAIAGPLYDGPLDSLMLTLDEIDQLEHGTTLHGHVTLVPVP